MILQQKAYRRTDEKMTDDSNRKLTNIITKIETMPVTGFKDMSGNTPAVSENVPMTKAEKSSALCSQLERSELMRKQSIN